MGISGVGVGAIGVGAVFVYGGLTGKSPLAAIQSVVRGNAPSAASVSSPIFADAPADNPATQSGLPGSSNPGTRGDQLTGPIPSMVNQELTSHGASKACVAGFLANFQLESSMNPASYNPGEGAIGLAQWEGPRRTNLQAFAAQRGTTETDAATQVAFLWHELSGSKAYVWLQVKNASNPQTAAAIIDAEYEVSAGKQRTAKMQAAQTFFNAGL